MSDSARESALALVSEHLQEAWDRKWPGTSVLRDNRRPADCWVRFHSLPGSQRYAETPAERAEVLRRHHAVLDDLMATSGDRELVVVCMEFGPDDSGAGWHSTVFPGAVFWRTAEAADSGGASRPTLWLDGGPRRVEELDAALLAIAEDAAGPVVITTASAAWRYHPYDGGADVIAPDRGMRDLLKAKYRDWLPTSPDGM